MFPKIKMQVVVAPAKGSMLSAPPVLVAGTHTVDYCCGHCDTVLMYADAEQVFGLMIRCTQCGSYNKTEV